MSQSGVLGRGAIQFVAPDTSPIPLEGPIRLRDEVEGRERIRDGDSESPELVPTSLKLASLAAAWFTQNRKLRVRQREELRRAINTVAEVRAWVVSRADPPQSVIQDVEDVTQSGLDLVQQELLEELASKKEEVSHLREVAEVLRELARNDRWEDPVEVSYSHTVRKGGELATQHETLTLVDTAEAEEAAATFERKLKNWELLQNQMQDDLERRRRQLTEAAESVAAFAAFSAGLVADVLAII